MQKTHPRITHLAQSAGVHSESVATIISQAPFLPAFYHIFQALSALAPFPTPARRCTLDDCMNTVIPPVSPPFANTAISSSLRAQAPTPLFQTFERPPRMRTASTAIIPEFMVSLVMRHFHLMRNVRWRPIINVDKLWSLVPAEEKKGLRADSSVVPVIDTLRHGSARSSETACSLSCRSS
ncbi:60S ribosomal protein L27a [Mycena venus]|uniref:60S ribosomal protein L27a n=1 Tax=Mycena venus TaxID=2733690 RepID=A0A8H6YZX5_9AGAR|nr:60S ribosomal protein L27a [Mycena venus]